MCSTASDLGNVTRKDTDKPTYKEVLEKIDMEGWEVHSSRGKTPSEQACF
jgi:hypothetical protein